jgi:hypothetical protein
MRKYFKSANQKEDDGWMMADAGNSAQDGQDYVITTNALHADQVPPACGDARSFTQLVAGLLNCFYGGVETKSLSEEQVMQMGVVEKTESIPHPANPTLPF